MTWWRLGCSKQPPTGWLDRWLTVLALSLEGIGWPTAAELWLEELARTPPGIAQTPDPTPTQPPAASGEGDPI